MPSISVFVSYSQDDEKHVDDVLALSDRLRSDGVDALIDQYEESPPEGWLTWMQTKIEAAQFVLIVCTETYKSRVEKNEEPGRGLGAIWESQLIMADLYRLQGRNSKYIPVLLKEGDQAFIPAILGSVTRYTLDGDDGYARLYARLIGQSTIEKPPLGSVHRLPPKARAWHSAFRASIDLRPLEILGPASFSYSHPKPPVNEVTHDNYLRTISRTLNASKRIDIVAVEGEEGIGKTTLLGQFSRSMGDSCISLFIDLDDRQTFDTDAIKLNIVRQTHWILHHNAFDRSSVDQESFQGYLDRIYSSVRRKPNGIFFLIDGLGELAAFNSGMARRIVDLLPPTRPERIQIYSFR